MNPKVQEEGERKRKTEINKIDNKYQVGESIKLKVRFWKKITK